MACKAVRSAKILRLLQLKERRMAAREPIKHDQPLRSSGADLARRPQVRIPKSAEILADEIRRMITRGELKEGDILQPEAQIIANFAVSRPTVREAFRILESEKLITVSRGARGGAHVHAPRAAHVARYAGYVLQSGGATYADVYQARTIMEPPAAKHVAETRSKDAPAILWAAIEEQRAAQHSDEFGRAVVNFHTQLINLTGNQTLILLFSALNGIIAPFQLEITARRDPRQSDRRSYLAGLKSHEKLAGLIEAGAADEAEAHWRRHMENAAKGWLNGGFAEGVVDWVD
jgi:GntR family transcriptional repressor for pyruvate dehydrogenase complex